MYIKSLAQCLTLNGEHRGVHGIYPTSDLISLRHRSGRLIFMWYGVASQKHLPKTQLSGQESST